MRIAIVGPGIMPIPPTGWGAVEILIWDSKVALEKLGHQVNIVNTESPTEIIKQINAFRPDFVHIQYDDFIELYPYVQYPCAITSHFGYLEQPDRWDYYGDRIAKPFGRIKPNIFCLIEIWTSSMFTDSAIQYVYRLSNPTCLWPQQSQNSSYWPRIQIITCFYWKICNVE